VQVLQDRGASTVKWSRRITTRPRRRFLLFGVFCRLRIAVARGRMSGMLQGKILVTGSSVDDSLLAPLREAGLTVVNPPGILTEVQLGQELQDARGYLLGGEEYGAGSAMRQAKNLEIVAFLGVGYESFIDMRTANELGIPVTNTPGTLGDSVAEFTIGMLLNSTRRIAEYAKLYRDGGAGAEEKQHDLAALTVGIVGLGDIGTRIMKILRAFGSHVVYYSRTRKPELEAAYDLQFLPLQDLAKASDAIILMTPGNASTNNLIDASVLQNLKPGTILINTARQEIVDPSALQAALRSGQISVAAFDVFYDGDVGAGLLREFDESRLIVTGHIASLTHEARGGMAKKAVASILNVLSGKPDEYIVNRS
jgi:lactate dehydrogenase-like 2-hydroxyacid dehydrogenase